jgi:hypothetical protein
MGYPMTEPYHYEGTFAIVLADPLDFPKVFYKHKFAPPHAEPEEIVVALNSEDIEAILNPKRQEHE